MARGRGATPAADVRGTNLWSARSDRAGARLGGHKPRVFSGKHPLPFGPAVMRSVVRGAQGRRPELADLILLAKSAGRSATAIGTGAPAGPHRSEGGEAHMMIAVFSTT